MNLDNVKIEKTKPEDVRGINDVLKVAWKATYHTVSHEEIDQMYNLTDEEIIQREDRYRSTPENKLHIVAKVEGNVIGLLNAQKEENKGQIKAIYILPEFHGKGIGKRLMNVALYWLRECSEVIVECAEYNEKAIGFYKSFGFENQVEIEDYVTKLGSKIPQVRLTKINYEN